MASVQQNVGGKPTWVEFIDSHCLPIVFAPKTTLVSGRWVIAVIFQLNTINELKEHHDINGKFRNERYNVTTHYVPVMLEGAWRTSALHVKWHNIVHY